MGLQASFGPSDRGIAAQIRHAVVPAAVDFRTRTVDTIRQRKIRRNRQVCRRETQFASQTPPVLHHPFDHHAFHQIFSVSLRTRLNCEKNSLAKTRSTV